MTPALPRNSTCYKIAGTSTFRLASSKILREWGANLQNVSKDVRKIYIADPGYKLVQVDQAGAEALIVAYLAPRGQYRTLFESGIKPHTFVALHVFADVWRKRFKNPEVVDAAIGAKIAELKALPGWKELDTFIKSSDNWPSDQRYYYLGKKIVHACVDKDTEVLTPTGWVKICDVDKTTQIASWNTDFTIKFEVPSQWSSYPFKGELLHFIEPELDQAVTPEHRMACRTWNDEIRVMTAKQLSTYKGARIPINGKFRGGTSRLTPDEMRFLVAYQADGSSSGNCIRFRFRKTRKIERLQKLLDRLQLKSSDYIDHESVYNITIYDVQKYIDILGEPKRFNRFLLDLSEEALEAFSEELRHWGGSTNGFIRCYFSKHKDNVEWAKTILHLTRRQGTVNPACRAYRMGINNRSFARLHAPRKLPYDGFVYCPTVSTGFFLIRRNGKISVTGNSSYGMRANTFVLAILKDSDGTVVLSPKTAENYLAKFHNLFPEIMRWHQIVQGQIKKDRTLRNLFGYPRLFTGYISDSDYKECYAFVPQSTVGTITNIAFTELQTYIEDEKLDWHMLANTHDSYMFEVPEKEVTRACQLGKFFIEKELVAPDGTVFKMRSEAQAGDNWAPHKKGINEGGLKEVA